MSVRTVVAGTLLAAGTLLIAVTALGMIRLPDVYNRMNAVAKAASLGLICVLLGVLLLRPGVRAAVVVGFAVLLQLLTAPVGSYALASAAYRAGVRLAPITRHDALARLRGRPARAPGTGRRPPPAPPDPSAPPGARDTGSGARGNGPGPPGT